MSATTGSSSGGNTAIVKMAQSIIKLPLGKLALVLGFVVVMYTLHSYGGQIVAAFERNAAMGVELTQAVDELTAEAADLREEIVTLRIGLDNFERRLRRLEAGGD